MLRLKMPCYIAKSRRPFWMTTSDNGNELEYHQSLRLTQAQWSRLLFSFALDFHNPSLTSFKKIQMHVFIPHINHRVKY